MPTYRVEETRVASEDVVELVDDARGERARILHGIGGTCAEYTVTRAELLYHVLDPPPDLDAIAAHPTRYGTPILFPFPNRVRDGRWTFRGHTHRFTDLWKQGHHIHGFVFDRPWRIVACRADESGARCEMSFSSAAHEGIGEQYPFPFELTVIYELGGGALRVSLAASNTGDSALPMGLGLHPYFRAPISDSTQPAACRVTVPAGAMWELDGQIPTGRVLPAEGRYDLREGRPLSELALDNVFTNVATRSGISQCVIEDRGCGLRTVMESGSAYREMVVFTPPDRRSICLEPYTCPTDCPNLTARGVDAGLIVLEPGRTFDASIRIVCEEMP